MNRWLPICALIVLLLSLGRPLLLLLLLLPPRSAIASLVDLLWLLSVLLLARRLLRRRQLTDSAQNNRLLRLLLLLLLLLLRCRLENVRRLRLLWVLDRCSRWGHVLRGGYCGVRGRWRGVVQIRLLVWLRVRLMVPRLVTLIMMSVHPVRLHLLLLGLLHLLLLLLRSLRELLYVDKYILLVHLLATLRRLLKTRHLLGELLHRETHESARNRREITGLL